MTDPDIKRRLKIFDTTLRDGEQSPGASMTVNEKLILAYQLEKLNVDVIEAGFAVSSQGDYKAIQQISKLIRTPTIAALARCVKSDIDWAIRSLKKARKSRLHVFIATSPIHMKYKLQMSETDVIKKAIESVSYAALHTDEVEFSAEDASRSDFRFLKDVLEAVIDAGATTINIPDTVGYSVPDEFAERIKQIKHTVSGIDSVDLSVHCHNDLGLAVANSIAAVCAGANQVECTINGIGERSGNCSLEELVMAIKTRQDYLPYYTDINTVEIYHSSRQLQEITGMNVQANKAIVGRNAFAHEAGIHQHGIIKHASTYEIIKPEEIGLDTNQMILGKHSGRHALKDWLKKINNELNEADFESFFEQFKHFADEMKTVTEDDLTNLLEHFKIRTTII